MTTKLSYLHLLFLSISGMLVLCTVFSINPDWANGIIMGKVHWLHTMMLLFAGSTLFMELTIKKKNNIRFTLSDGLLLTFTVITLITYDWQLNPAPEKLLFGGQMVMLWFMLRLAIKNYQPLLMFYLSIIISTGIFEALYGIAQLNGLSASLHSLFHITGSFFNPGPFCGYLSIVLPVSLGIFLRFSHCNKTKFNDPTTTLFYLSLIAIILILIVLPAGMSRSAWIAATVSCLWVYICYRKTWRYIGKLWKEQRPKLILSAFTGILVLFIGAAMIYNLKKDSADGRLLMWRMTAKAISGQPMAGVGTGGFAAVFAQTQAEYFASGKATETELFVAGCPEYAFNEYLQMGLEKGVPALILFLVWIGYSLYYGVKSKRYGTTGGIIALMVFAFSSYPLQLPSFWVLLIFLSAICISTNKRKEKCYEEKAGNIPYVGILVATGSFLLYWGQAQMDTAYSQWPIAKALYNSKAYSIAANNYAALYPQLKQRHEYLFEYAQCLSNTEDYEKANGLLHRATRLSADPMLFYIMAKNEQALGNYNKAEKLLLHAINILPERIYPYYLLAKLYADPGFNQPEKMKEAACIVLNKKPKVESTAITEMRNNVRKMLAGVQME